MPHLLCFLVALFKQLCNVCFDRLGRVAWRIARYDFAILVAQKLGEIPLDGRCAKNARLLFFKELPKRVSL